MTLSTTTILACDECGDTVTGVNAAEARKTARSRRWQRHEGTDLCHACVHDRERAAERRANADIDAWLEGA